MLRRAASLRLLRWPRARLPPAGLFSAARSRGFIEHARAPPASDHSLEHEAGEGTSYFDAERFEAELRETADAAGAAALRERALAAVAELGDCDDSRKLSESVIVSLVRERHAKAAWEAFDAVRSHGVKPTSGAFAAVIQACALTDEVERAEGAIDAMAKLALWPPPTPCWDNLLFAYAARAEALGELTHEEKAALRRHSVPTSPDSVVEGALSVLRRMSAEGLSASASTHLGLLHVLAAAGQPRRAQAVLAALLHARAPVGEAHFACAIDACGIAARHAPGGAASEELLAEALGVLDALEVALGAPPSPRALRAVLRAYARAGRLNRALEWLASGYAAHGEQPTAECFGVAVRMCRETARPDVALEVLRRARASGLALGATDGAAEQLRALAVRWQLGSALHSGAGTETRAHAASRVLFELADEMRHHPPLQEAALDVLARAELGASKQPQLRVLALPNAGVGSAPGALPRNERRKLRLADRKPEKRAPAMYGARRERRS